MAINLEMPKKLQAVIDMAHDGAAEMLRPISRKYDLAEHAYPVELDTLADLFEGITAANTISFAGHRRVPRVGRTQGKRQRRQHVRARQRARDQLG